MVKLKPWVVAMLFLVIVIPTACTDSRAKSVTVISPVEFQQAIKRNRDLQLVDVRTTEEFRVGHLEDAQNICVTDSDFKAKVKELDKQKPVYVYCRKGGRSAKAAEILLEMGFTEVYDLEGGLANWEAEGRDVSK